MNGILNIDYNISRLSSASLANYDIRYGSSMYQKVQFNVSTNCYLLIKHVLLCSSTVIEITPVIDTCHTIYFIG